jgi:hypothetical protein
MNEIGRRKAEDMAFLKEQLCHFPVPSAIIPDPLTIRNLDVNDE